MKALNVLLALLVSALIAVGVFEGGLRLIGMGPPKTLNQFDPAVGWVKKPGHTVTRKTPEFTVEFALNDLGLRDDADQSQAKPQGTTRVLCLGDSFTLGFGVGRDELFVDQLENWWSAEGRPVDVVNAGTEAYATDQEVAWLQEHGEAWAPDVVLLLAYENDLYYNGQERYLRSSKPRFNLAGERETGKLEDTGAKSFFQKTAIGNLVASKDRLETFRPEGGSREVFKEFGPLFKKQPEFMADALARTTGTLRAFKAKCDELGARAVLVTIPSHSAVDEDFAEGFGKNFLGVDRTAWDPNRPVQAFLAAAKQAGVQTIDPSAQLRARHASGTELYHQVDFHLNPAGNHALAEILHADLDKLNVMPAASQVLALADVDKPAKASGGLPTWLYWFGGLWLLIGSLYLSYYEDERGPLAFLKVGALLATVFTIAIGGTTLIGMLPPTMARYALIAVILAILIFVLCKLGDRIGTITELIVAFVGRGHWYLMPLVVILLTVGSLLVVAATSPLVAPFIYTLF